MIESMFIEINKTDDSYDSSERSVCHYNYFLRTILVFNQMYTTVVMICCKML